jgi:hypothetical protein
MERSLRPSSTTLLIAPLTLIELWFEQITKHVNLTYLAPKNSTIGQNGIPRGVVFLDGLGDIADVSAPLPKLQIGSQVGATAAELSTYLLVITSLERCTQEQKRCITLHKHSSVSRCVYLEIRWLRVVVDEGHELSPLDIPNKIKRAKASTGDNAFICSRTVNSLNSTVAASAHPTLVGTAYTLPTPNGAVSSVDSPAATADSTENSDAVRGLFDAHAKDRAFEEQRKLAAVFINSIAAERRWVMSGTPTRGNSSASALNQLLRLLAFLRHPKYGLADAEEENMNDDHVDDWREALLSTDKFGNPKSARKSRKRQLQELQDTGLLGNEAWNTDIFKPFLARSQEGWDNVNKILRGTVIAHSKVL